MADGKAAHEAGAAGGEKAVLSNATMRVECGRVWFVGATVSSSEDELDDSLDLDVALSKRSRSLWGIMVVSGWVDQGQN